MAPGPATALLYEARTALGVDDCVLWLQSFGALVTEVTTVTSGRAGVDIPVGQGIAGRAFSTNSVVIVDDFQDVAELERRQLRMQQPGVVKREGWRSAIYVPLAFPSSTAVLAAYSERAGNFTGREAPAIEVWGERVLLRTRWQRLFSRPVKLARIYDSVANHIHDIRQYADTALMNVEAIREGSSRAKIDRSIESLKSLRALCERDLRVVTKAVVRNRLCNVTEVVNDLVHEMRTYAESRHVAILLRAEDNVPGLIDPSELHRAVSNLITNSLTQLKSVQRDRKQITVEVSKGSQSVVAVSDNGPGIQPDRVPRIFEPGTSFSHNGYGLGLSQVEAAVSAVGGEVRVTANNFGNGCTFTLYLPSTR